MFDFNIFLDAFGATLPDAIRIRCLQEFTAGRADQLATWAAHGVPPEAVPAHIREDYRAHLDYLTLKAA